MRHITIYECFDTLQITKNPTENAITVEEADELNRYIIKENLKQSNISWGRNSIIFINYVGFIKLSTVSIEILPKINISSKEYHQSRKALINMLNKSGIIKFNYSNVGMLNMYKMSLNEILTLIFAKTLQKELVKGPYLEYVNIEENSKALKGSIVVKEHIKNISSCRSDIYCRYEEFSINNKLNQILNTCIDKSIKSVKNSDTIKILNHLKVVYSDVSTIDITNKEAMDFKFTRLNSRFESSLLLAKMILNGYSSTGNKGDDKSFAILFEMNEVYERYISNLLSIHLEDYIVHSQHTKYKLLRNEKTSKNIFSLKPDIVIEHNKKYKIIIDTKWKKIDSNTIRHGVKREDFYQMYAYLTKYEDANAAILLYPSNENIHNDDEYLESWSLEDEQSKKIRVYNIGLDNEEKTVKKLRNIIQSNLN